MHPSWLDALGHVNNARYGDMIYDQLCLDASTPARRVRRLELYFVGELHGFEEVALLRRDTEEEISILGLHGKTGDHAFYSRVFF